MTNNTSRRTFIGTAAGAGAALMMHNKVARGFSGNSRFELEEATVGNLKSAMESGEASAKDIAKAYLERIKAIDPKINSMIELNPEALAIAEELDKERASGQVRSPMHGIPVVIKDNIDTADKMKTTAGSLALVDAPVPREDAGIVAQLREAGAVLLGKTNLSEWANFRSNDSSSGWSGRGGQTRNPYILDRNPCGSSSGTGAAISASLAAVGIGTETDGSIVCPSSICGIVGVKPTVGLVSRSGIIPIAHTQDTAGPMTRTVEDAAILLSAISGEDSRDSATKVPARKAENDYTKFLDKAGLKGARIGVARDYWGRNEKVDAVLDEALESMKKEGAELVDVKFETFRQFGDAEFEVLLYEFKADLNKYLSNRGGKHKTLADLIRFNEDNKDKEMPYFGQEIFISAEEKGPLTSSEYVQALKKCGMMSRDQGLDAALNGNKLDAIVAPSNGPTWMIDLVSGDCGSGYVGSSQFPAVSGYPNITVPFGFVKELPIGVSFMGGAWQEPKLFKLAYAFEQATKGRKKPKYLPTYV
ncbi:MAG: amidase [Acidobacteria bacterium]|nr:MAG: amidase [Acidobacteriota bacterium]REK02224.1 MAG: amidase [Acidobacteriota bacterium]REK13973.1 MAG: amidase [Acidobacteriota bacterium]REK41968.1 MAG: amidase [Acidobacteriota bacterium]